MKWLELDLDLLTLRTHIPWATTWLPTGKIQNIITRDRVVNVHLTRSTRSPGPSPPWTRWWASRSPRTPNERTPVSDTRQDMRRDIKNRYSSTYINSFQCLGIPHFATYGKTEIWFSWYALYLKYLARYVKLSSREKTRRKNIKKKEKKSWLSRVPRLPRLHTQPTPTLASSGKSPQK